MILQLTINGQVPGGKNGIKTTAMGGRYPSKRFAAWRDDAKAQVERQLSRIQFHSPIKVKCRYDVKVYQSDNRRRDVPSMMDAVWHVLENTDILEDDYFLRGGSWDEFFDVENPRVEIQITTLPEEQQHGIPIKSKKRKTKRGGASQCTTHREAGQGN